MFLSLLLIWLKTRVAHRTMILHKSVIKNLLLNKYTASQSVFIYDLSCILIVLGLDLFGLL